MALAVRRVAGELPGGLDRLAAAAAVEGVAGVDRLAREWASGEQRFDGPGEALFAAWCDDRLAGVGGVTVETRLPEPAMRMRRLYVLPERRRAGVGRALASAIIERGFAAAPLLTVNAVASSAAGPFWEALGFERVATPGVTHQRRRPPA